MMRFASNKKSLLAVPDHLRATHTAKRAKGGEQIDCFENVGFALRIISKKQMESRAELAVEPPIIAKIAQPELAQVHAGVCWRRGIFESSTILYLLT